MEAIAIRLEAIIDLHCCYSVKSFIIASTALAQALKMKPLPQFVRLSKHESEISARWPCLGFAESGIFHRKAAKGSEQFCTDVKKALNSSAPYSRSKVHANRMRIEPWL